MGLLPLQPGPTSDLGKGAFVCQLYCVEFSTLMRSGRPILEV